MKYLSMLLSCVLMLSSCATSPVTPHVDDSTVMLKMKIGMAVKDETTGATKEKSGWGSM